MYVGSLIRDVLKNASVVKLHRMERSEHFTFARAVDGSDFNRDAFDTATICGCFECCHIIDSKDIVEWDGEKSAVCPICGTDSIIMDSQGYTITEDFLQRLNDYLNE